MRHFSNIEKIASFTFQPSQLSIAVEILKLYNCRAAEVLSAKWEDFIPDYRLILEGKKRSANIIIHDRIILTAIARLPKVHSTKIFPSINYYHLYHHIKNNYSHLFLKWKKRKYNKVTHGFRYRAVERVANDEKIQDILHHRSKKSGKFYKLKEGVK